MKTAAFPTGGRDLLKFGTQSDLDNKVCVAFKKREWMVALASVTCKRSDAARLITHQKAMRVKCSLNKRNHFIWFGLSWVYSGFFFSVSSVIPVVRCSMV